MSAVPPAVAAVLEQLDTETPIISALVLDELAYQKIASRLSYIRLYDTIV
ncbi:MAG TPA: hypothetical protein VFR48_11005 [Solirubrobacteraceae bacterium]|nr:hypothetical protein [Solirubrobacteraceae bacterium]